MNKIEFSDNITAYLDGDLNKEQIQEFESLLESDPECREMFDGVVSIIGDVKNLPKVETSSNFIPNLNKRIDEYKSQDNTIFGRVKDFFGVSPSASASSSSGESPSIAVSFNSGLVLAMSFSLIFLVSYFALNPTQSQSALSAEQISTPPQEQDENTDYLIADIDTTENEEEIQLVNGEDE